MPYSHNAPFRADVVGSYLRPAELKAAREEFAAGKIDAAALKAVEDKSITELIAKQKAAGLHVITDGEFRRGWWHLDCMWGFDGVQKVSMDKGYMFHDEETRAESARLNGKIAFNPQHPFIGHFRFVKQFEDDQVVARQTIPAPAQLYAELFRPENLESVHEFYGDTPAAYNALADDTATAFHELILALYDAGCRNVQLDDCTWGMFCDPHFNSHYSAEEFADLQKLYAHMNNAAIKNLPEDLVVTTHDCRGNYHSTWASAGGYSTVADVLFGEENVGAYYLEFDDDRSGDFAPLAKVSGDKKVVLGLITSKKPELEDPETIKARIEEAAKYVPLDRLCLSTQCGFASTEEGNKLTEEQQWAKIALVRSIAKDVWGE
ncbi:MAG TPA: 5-methyltetrahydropteroyltriglutamate--homocysteine methyltransferase [Bifidobacterium sp.]|nr:5-methyltetrahydropteroyltriglutamate--homocysteine methyltransferase [Bifidobacterium sp.]